MKGTSALLTPISVPKAISSTRSEIIQPAIATLPYASVSTRLTEPMPSATASGRERHGQADGGDGAPYREHLAARHDEQGSLYRAVAAHLSYKVDGSRGAPDEGSRRRSRHAPAEDEDEGAGRARSSARSRRRRSAAASSCRPAAEDGVYDVGEAMMRVIGGIHIL